MEAERYVVRELEGYNITQRAAGGNNARLSLEVSVLDLRENYRIVQAFRSEQVHRVVGQGRGLAVPAVAYAQVRAQAAELAARLNETSPASDGCRTCHRPWTECEC
jgi:hypothetical protein